METLMEARALSKEYRGRNVVDAVSLELRSGRVLALIGPNGAGKTTTVRMLLSLTHATSGEVRVAGQWYTELREPGRTVGALLENPGFYPGRTGLQHAEIVGARVGASKADVRDVLSEVGLSDASKRRIRTYSLGMKQRLGLACALLGRPQILLLDEPVNGLDPDGIQWVRHYVRRFAENGGAVLITSHLLGELEHVADDVVVIDGGRVRLSTSMSDVRAQGSLEDVYMSATRAQSGADRSER